MTNPPVMDRIEGAKLDSAASGEVYELNGLTRCAWRREERSGCVEIGRQRLAERCHVHGANLGDLAEFGGESRIDLAAALPAYHDLPNLMFMHFLRSRAAYRTMIERLGLRVPQEGEVMLDMPFLLLVAAAQS